MLLKSSLLSSSSFYSSLVLLLLLAWWGTFSGHHHPLLAEAGLCSLCSPTGFSSLIQRWNQRRAAKNSAPSGQLQQQQQEEEQPAHNAAAGEPSNSARRELTTRRRELFYVQAMWRHGDNAPNSEPYPQDPFWQTHWQKIASQLTEKGKQQMKELGDFFHQRYVKTGFINSSYKGDKEQPPSIDPQKRSTTQISPQVYVLTSRVKRAVDSAELMLDTFLASPQYDDMNHDLFHHHHHHQKEGPITQTSPQQSDHDGGPSSPSHFTKPPSPHSVAVGPSQRLENWTQKGVLHTRLWNEAEELSTDPLVHASHFYCPAYDELFTRIASSLEQNLRVTYAELFAYLEGEIPGWHLTPPSLKDVLRLHNVCREQLDDDDDDHDDNHLGGGSVGGGGGALEVSHKWLPHWAKKRWPQYSEVAGCGQDGTNPTTIELAAAMNEKRRVSKVNRVDLSRLLCGYLLGDWLQRADRVAAAAAGDSVGGSDKMRELENGTKMLLYSSHGIPLQGLLVLLGVSEGESVDASDCIIMEIYKTSSKVDHVAVAAGRSGLVDSDQRVSGIEVDFLHRHLDGTLTDLTADVCGSQPCTMEKLSALFQNKMIKSRRELYQECGLDENGRSSNMGQEGRDVEP